MELAEEVDIPVSLPVVWASLNDPAILKQSLPGCESFERADGDKFVMTVLAKVGPVKARFNGEVSLGNIVPEQSYTLTGSGKGGVAGFARGAADVSLRTETRAGFEVTVMSYQVHANVGGKLAQVGSRLVSGAARKMAHEFFTNFVSVLTTGDLPKKEI